MGALGTPKRGVPCPTPDPPRPVPLTHRSADMSRLATLWCTASTFVAASTSGWGPRGGLLVAKWQVWCRSRHQICRLAASPSPSDGGEGPRTVCEGLRRGRWRFAPDRLTQRDSPPSGRRGRWRFAPDRLTPRNSPPSAHRGVLVVPGAVMQPGLGPGLLVEPGREERQRRAPASKPSRARFMDCGIPRWRRCARSARRGCARRTCRGRCGCPGPTDPSQEDRMPREGRVVPLAGG